MMKVGMLLAIDRLTYLGMDVLFNGINRASLEFICEGE